MLRFMNEINNARFKRLPTLKQIQKNMTRNANALQRDKIDRFFLLFMPETQRDTDGERCAITHIVT